MFELLEKCEAIYNRIKVGNYSIEYYYFLLNSQKELLAELRLYK
jgi:hypothetical protein